MEDVNTRQQFSFSFPELRYNPLEFNPRKNRYYSPNWTRWNKFDKVWSSVNILLNDGFVAVAVVVALKASLNAGRSTGKQTNVIRRSWYHKRSWYLRDMLYFKKLKLGFISIEFQRHNNGLVLLFKTVYHWNCFLWSFCCEAIARMLNLQTFGQLFQVLMLCLQKSTIKAFIDSTHWWNLFDIIFIISLMEQFVYGQRQK